MSNYRDYLASPHWQKVRMEAIKRAKYCCQLCNSRKRLEVHHRTYERLGRELPEDVIALCDGCHEIFHKQQKLYKPGISRAFRQLLERQGVL